MSLSVETIIVSICVPIYGVEKYIERCARSLFEQTYAEIEYIFVDDCSPDNSIAILQQIIGEYPNRKDQIKIFHHNHNRGLAAARNTAIENASGDFIIHVDSDDWIEPNMVELLVKKQQETNADIVSCNAIAHYSDHPETLIEPDYSDKDAMLHQTIQLTLNHVIWRRLIRRSLYEDNHIRCVEGGNIGEDHYTLPRLVYYAKSFAKVDAALYHYNCENQSSYMHATPSYASYYRKYSSDVKALDILLNFFQDKSQSLFDELSAIKINLIYNNLFTVVKHGVKEHYDFSSQELSSIDKIYWNELRLSALRERLLVNHYYVNRMRVLCKILINKTTHIKRYYL